VFFKISGSVWSLQFSLMAEKSQEILYPKDRDGILFIVEKDSLLGEDQR
jgi:hypothetical protein